MPKGFQKGRAKTGGRKKNTPNKVNSSVKTIIENILSEYSNSGMMSMDFNSLDPKDRLAIAEKFSQYVMPKIQSVSVDVDSSVTKITIEQELINLSQE
jgi:hypothetical protein